MSTMSMSQRKKQQLFSSRIIKWWLKNGRNFLWRENRTPYSVFVSEYMLVRTKAVNVVGPFNNFMKKHPMLETLEPGKNLKKDCHEAFSSLGLLRRGTSFYDCLIQIYDKGIVPFKSKELEKLPYVGQYIRAAVRIFGFGIRDAIIDINVVRIISRYEGIKVNDSTRRSKEFKNIAWKYIPESNFVEYSYGLLDYASEICTKNPHCEKCILKNFCCLYTIKSSNI